jgi:hypothetical protein
MDLAAINFERPERVEKGMRASLVYSRFCQKHLKDLWRGISIPTLDDLERKISEHFAFPTPFEQVQLTKVTTEAWNYLF